MFKNMGGKIKKLAKFFCWVGIIITILVGVCMIIAAGRMPDEAYVEGMSVVLNPSQLLTWLGAAVIVLGPLFSWIGMMYLYGFGELVENYMLETTLRIKAKGGN